MVERRRERSGGRKIKSKKEPPAARRAARMRTARRGEASPTPKGQRSPAPGGSQQPQHGSMAACSIQLQRHMGMRRGAGGRRMAAATAAPPSRLHRPSATRAPRRHLRRHACRRPEAGSVHQLWACRSTCTAGAERCCVPGASAAELQAGVRCTGAVCSSAASVFSGLRAVASAAVTGRWRHRRRLPLHLGQRCRDEL
jgi:hypothetical protein